MKKLFLFPVVLVLIFCVTCQKEVVESQEYPRVNTLEVSNITPEGAAFYADILSLGSNPIIEYGFLWDTISDLAYTHSEKIEIKETISKGKFDCVINTSLIKNKSYFVKAYVRTQDYTVLGEAVTFTSKGSIPPKINSFSPQSAHWGDTLLIKGEKFSFKSNDVKLGQLKAHVIFNSDSLIKAIVPAKINDAQVKIFVNTTDASSSSGDYFHYLQPQLKVFSPAQVSFNDTVFINGENFNSNNAYTKVKLSAREVNTVFLSESLIKFVMPTNITTSSNIISIVSEGVTCTAKSPLELKPFYFNETITDTIKDLTDDIFITILGEGFNPDIEHNHITIDNVTAEVIEVSPSKLVFKFPKQAWSFDLNYTFERKYNLSLSIADQTRRSTNLFVLKNKGKYTWKYKPGFPGTARAYAASFVLNSKAYVGTGYNGESYFSDFYEFNPANNSWKQIASLPGGGRAEASAFVINGQAYVGLGSDKIHGYTDELSPHLKKDFYKYDAENDTWIQLNDFSGQPRSSAYTFIHNDNLYLGSGDIPSTTGSGYIGAINDLWLYDIALDSWIKLEETPVYRGEGFSYDGNGYVSDREELYKYSNGTWTQDKTYYVGFDYSVCTLKDKAYLVLPNDHHGGTTSIYALGLKDNSWEKIDFPGKGRSLAASFVIDNSLYVVLGEYFSSSQWKSLYLKDMYELEISE